MRQAGKRPKLMAIMLCLRCYLSRRRVDPLVRRLIQSFQAKLEVAIGRGGAHIAPMDIFSRFEAKVMTSGRWFVSVTTGYGPDSHVGNFATDKDAKDWILTKSRYWPGKPATP